jgi:hypothetical protein
MTEQLAPVVEEQRERRLTDRRRARFHHLVYGAIVHGRRRRPRRHSDARGYYVDRYDGGLFAVAVGILLFCCLDALFTLILLGMGAEEVNLFMAALLEEGVPTFVYTKLALTGIGLVFLVVHAAFQLAGAVRVRHILYSILGSYMTLFVYQVGMLTRVF